MRDVTGRPSYNLDGWMCGRQRVLDAVARAAADADVAVVEGVMGCFDGVDGVSEDGSTAADRQVARRARACSCSTRRRRPAARARSCSASSASIPISAWPASSATGGRPHARAMDRRGMSRRPAAPSRSARSPTIPSLILPERHLGLHTAAEGGADRPTATSAGSPTPSRAGVDAAIGSWRWPASCRQTRCRRRAPLSATRARIGVARDAAFQFYYAENLGAARGPAPSSSRGARWRDADVPDVDGLYLGGGYPELHAAALADNGSVRKAVRRLRRGGPSDLRRVRRAHVPGRVAGGRGRPRAADGRLLPAAVRMRAHGLTIGYAEVTLAGRRPAGRGGHAGARAGVSRLDAGAGARGGPARLPRARAGRARARRGLL